MSVIFEVLTIAIGTAVLAALIVAADWDLAIIRAWTTLVARKERAVHRSAWAPSSSDTSVTGLPAGEGYPVPTPYEPTGAANTTVGKTDRDMAEAWLAAAAAHQLPEFVRAEPSQPTRTAPLRATPLREVLATRRAEPPIDPEAEAEAEAA